MNTEIKLTGQCVICGKKEILTENQIEAAKAFGCALSTCCSSPMTIEKAEVSAK